MGSNMAASRAIERDGVGAHERQQPDAEKKEDDVSQGNLLFRTGRIAPTGVKAQFGRRARA